MDSISLSEMKNRFESINAKVKSACEFAGRTIDSVTVVAVAKTHGADSVKIALQAGFLVIGENYVQELQEKHSALENFSPKPEWHYIGHLQTNKVKFIAPYISMIHSVDSLHLAQEISKEAAKHNRTIDILLQVNTSGEESKSGCEPNELHELYGAIKALPNIAIKGLMTIGSFSSDMELVKSEFSLLRSLKEQLNNSHPDANLKHLSMGMTGDYELAIAEGATFVRIGTAIFGSRYYA